MWDWLVGWLVDLVDLVDYLVGLDCSILWSHILTCFWWLGGSGQIFENTNGRSEDAAVVAFFEFSNHYFAAF